MKLFKTRNEKGNFLYKLRNARFSDQEFQISENRRQTRKRKSDSNVRPIWHYQIQFRKSTKT